MTNEEKQLFESIIHTLDTAGHGVMNWRDIEDCRAKLKLASMCPATVTEQAPASEAAICASERTCFSSAEKCNHSFNQNPLAHPQPIVAATPERISAYSVVIVDGDQIQGSVCRVSVLRGDIVIDEFATANVDLSAERIGLAIARAFLTKQ